jgi:hypothetical protein
MASSLVDMPGTRSVTLWGSGAVAAHDVSKNATEGIRYLWFDIVLVLEANNLLADRTAERSRVKSHSSKEPEADARRGTGAIWLLSQATSPPSCPKSVMQPLYSTSIHIIRNSTSGRSASRSSTGRNYLRSIDREKSLVRRKSNGRHHTNSLACGSELPAQAVDDTQAGIHSRASGGQHAACHAPVRQLLRLAATMKLQLRPQENICATSICISEVEDLLCELVNYDEERVCLSSCTS